MAQEVLVVSEVLEVLAAPDTTIHTTPQEVSVPVPWATTPVSRNPDHQAPAPTITRLHTTTSKIPPALVLVPVAPVPTTALDSGLGLDLMALVVLVRLVSDIMVVLMGTTVIMDR